MAEVVARLRAAGCVFAEDEARLLLDAAGSPDELEAMLARRVAGEPLEHVLGWAAFCGIRIAVDAGVFVPRPRTDFLVREAARLARPGAVIVDLCCGSGALGVALAALLGRAEVHAVDIDPAAVRCACRNLSALPDADPRSAPRGDSGAVTATVYQGDLFAPLPARLRGHVDVLLANVPYVPTDEIALLPAEARDHEARVALDGGPDGLTILRRVGEQAQHWLTPGGHALVETSSAQAPAAAEAFPNLDTRIAESTDYHATVVIATA